MLACMPMICVIGISACGNPVPPESSGAPFIPCPVDEPSGKKWACIVYAQDSDYRGGFKAPYIHTNYFYGAPDELTAEDVLRKSLESAGTRVLRIKCMEGSVFPTLNESCIIISTNSDDAGSNSATCGAIDYQDCVSCSEYFCCPQRTLCNGDLSVTPQVPADSNCQCFVECEQ